MRDRFLRGAMVVLALAACDDDQTDAATSAAATSSASAAPLLETAEEPEEQRGPSKKGEAKKAGERIEVPGGRVMIGSTPGDVGRDPSLEPARLEVEVGAFSIDRLPFPNDPAKKPLTGVTREKAASLCDEAGGRLCTEVEWERACKGPEGDRYAGGSGWDADCAGAPETCASGFGVLGMGAALREWTASTVAPIPGMVPEGMAAVRGAQAKAAATDHRCAHRTALRPAADADDLGFRCCHGEPTETAIASPAWKPTITPANMSPEKLQELFAADPHLAIVSKDIKFFHDDEAGRTVVARGKRRGGDDFDKPHHTTQLTTTPLAWSPVPGETIVLATGQSGDHSFIVALHQLPDDRYRVGAALVMKDELGPVVFAYNEVAAKMTEASPFRNKLFWATCWECFGQMGRITWKDDRVIITQSAT